MATFMPRERSMCENRDNSRYRSHPPERMRIRTGHHPSTLAATRSLLDRSKPEIWFSEAKLTSLGSKARGIKHFRHSLPSTIPFLSRPMYGVSNSLHCSFLLSSLHTLSIPESVGIRENLLVVRVRDSNPGESELLVKWVFISLPFLGWVESASSCVHRGKREWCTLLALKTKAKYRRRGG